MTDEQLTPAASHGNEPIIVEIDGIGELEFPGDTDQSVIQAKVQELTGGGQPEHPHARVGKWVAEHAPMIGAGVAAAASGGASLPLQAIAAGGGAFLGARLRGDSRSDAAVEGVKQGAMEGAFGLGAKALKAVARPIYRAAIPKAIQDKFARVDLTGQGLESRTLLGTKRGAETAAKANTAAGEAIAQEAGSVPTMTARDVQSAFGPKYNKALVARRPDRAKEIGAYVKQSMDDIGMQPMNGAAQLARKEVLEQEGKSAMNAANSNLAAVNPQLANIERRAITKNLRVSKPMAKALDKSQAAIGINKAAQSTQNSSVVNRLSHGGVWNAAKSPAGLSGTAIGINELSKIPFAQLVRMAQLAQLSQQ